MNSPLTQGSPKSWSGATPGVDRTRHNTVSASKPRVAESWSNVPKHDDRTWIRATVDIRERDVATESWSSLQAQVDRIRLEGAGTQSSLSWTRPAVGGVAISAATVALFLSAPAAFADAQPTGATPVATAGQVTPTTTDTTTTTSTTTDTGTPVSNESTLGPSSVTTGGPDTQAGDAAGGATASSDTGNGTLTIIVSSAGSPNSSGSPASSTGPPGTSTTSTTDTTPTTDTSGTTPTTVDNPPSSNSQSAQGQADSSQSGAQNGNVSVRVDHGGDTGQVTQGNNASSSATGTASGDVPATGTDPSGSAAATTTQDSPNNSNVNVRVGSPGDISGVNQQNTSTANASSSGPTGNAGAGGGNANATASQTSPDNVNVTVRVDSPGNNGNVTQQNTVGATAGPNANPAPPAGSASSGPAQTDQVTATTNSGAGQSNSGTVDQQLLQTQDGNGPNVAVTGDPAITPAGSSSTGTANATQTGARNVNVSIRVGSPGMDGTVTQTNGANATGTSPDLSVTKIVDASNLNLSVVLPGGAAVAPGADWGWNWTWTGDGTPPAGATADTAAPTTGAIWNWLWSQTPATATATTAGTSGFFTWDWTWTMADGTVWTLHQQQACDCNWNWTALMRRRRPTAAMCPPATARTTTGRSRRTTPSPRRPTRPSR
jgi:chitinase